MDDYSVAHTKFIEPNDVLQNIYERARRAAIDSRIHPIDVVDERLANHGLAGLFLDPSEVLIAVSNHKKRLSDRKGTAMENTHLNDKTFVAIATSLAEGVGVSSIARIQNIQNRTVLRVLVQSGLHGAAISKSLMKNLKVTECQLDEMWSFVYKKEKNLSDLESLVSTIGDAWIWIAFDAVNKVFLAKKVGKRTQENANDLMRRLKEVTVQMPDLFSSDQLVTYTQALLNAYGVLEDIPKKAGAGRPPKPRLVPPKNLLYVQVVKQYKMNRIEKVSRKVIFGDPKRVEEILATSLVSAKINTSFIERANGTIRHIDARCNRKTLRFSKLYENHEHQLDLSLTYYHLCRPHSSLTKRYGRPTTPFMATGLTNHVWTMEELLTTQPANLDLSLEPVVTL